MTLLENASPPPRPWTRGETEVIEMFSWPIRDPFREGALQRLARERRGEMRSRLPPSTTPLSSPTSLGGPSSPSPNLSANGGDFVEVQQHANAVDEPNESQQHTNAVDESNEPQTGLQELEQSLSPYSQHIPSFIPSQLRRIWIENPPATPPRAPGSGPDDSQPQSFLSFIPEPWRAHWRAAPPPTPPRGANGRTVVVDIGYSYADAPEPGPSQHAGADDGDTNGDVDDINAGPPSLIPLERPEENETTVPGPPPPYTNGQEGFELPPNNRRALEDPLTGLPVPLPISTTPASHVFRPTDSPIPRPAPMELPIRSNPAPSYCHHHQQPLPMICEAQVRICHIEIEVESLRGKISVLENQANALRRLIAHGHM